MTIVKLAKASDLAIKQKTVTLTHADLLAITEAAPGIVVPAPGAGKVLVPFSIMFDRHIVAPYATDSDWTLFIGSATTTKVSDDAIGLTASRFAAFGYPSAILVSDRADLINQPIVFSPMTGGSPLQDGDPGNTVTWIVGYYEYTVPA